MLRCRRGPVCVLTLGRKRMGQLMGNLGLDRPAFFSMDPEDILNRPSDRHWKLDKDGEPVRCKNLREWCAFTDGGDPNNPLRVVARTRVGPCEISTVFLMIDHRWGDGPPILWETMVFTDSPNHKMNHDCDRCAGRREQAEAMHAKMVAHVQKLFPNAKVNP